MISDLAMKQIDDTENGQKQKAIDGQETVLDLHLIYLAIML
jgi:hypothetical protein